MYPHLLQKYCTGKINHIKKSQVKGCFFMYAAYNYHFK